MVSYKGKHRISGELVEINKIFSNRPPTPPPLQKDTFGGLASKHKWTHNSMLFNNLYSNLLVVFRFKVDLLSIDYFSGHYKEKIGDKTNKE